MKPVIACIDGSAASIAVCDYAAWASTRLAAPLTFLHVLYRPPIVRSDLSGNLGIDARISLMNELVALDERRGRLARENGQYVLEAAKHHVDDLGVVHPQSHLRYGTLVDCLKDVEADTGLVVIGRRGGSSNTASQILGSQVENVVRAIDCPVLVVSGRFTIAQRFLIAYDGSDTAQRCVEKLAASTLLKGLDCHVLMVGGQTTSSHEQIYWAKKTLQEHGYAVTTAIHGGEADAVINNYCKAERIDLLVMGAYGHSRIRQFFVGSTTTKMLRQVQIPLLLVR
ncbi:MAG: universal stress protein [Pseudomonas sp.]|nr:MAG: universal stress protein [Pseudomonas sp.]